jgi:ATP-dependent RNA helicase RhlE
VHRIGRTARAGADGVAISLVSHDELPYLRDIEKLIRMAIPASGRSAPQAAQPQRQHQGGRGQRNGHRNGQGRQNGHGRGHGGQAHAQGRSQDRNGGRNRDRSQNRNANRNGHSAPPRMGDPAKPRPIASTEPVRGDFATVGFMQPR